MLFTVLSSTKLHITYKMPLYRLVSFISSPRPNDAPRSQNTTMLRALSTLVPRRRRIEIPRRGTPGSPSSLGLKPPLPRPWFPVAAGLGSPAAAPLVPHRRRVGISRRRRAKLPHRRLQDSILPRRLPCSIHLFRSGYSALFAFLFANFCVVCSSLGGGNGKAIGGGIASPVRRVRHSFRPVPNFGRTSNTPLRRSRSASYPWRSHRRCRRRVLEIPVGAAPYSFLASFLPRIQPWSTLPPDRAARAMEPAHRWRPGRRVRMRERHECPVQAHTSLVCSHCSDDRFWDDLRILEESPPLLAVACYPWAAVCVFDVRSPLTIWRNACVFSYDASLYFSQE